MVERTGNVTVENISVRQTKIVKPEEAREALLAAVKAIPLDRLKNFRTGQITIVM